MDYISIKKTAEKWNISSRRIQKLCNEGRVTGAKKIGTCWAIPVDAKKPDDLRIRRGKYTNNGE